MTDLKLLVKQIPQERSTHFKPDKEIFTETTEFDYDTLKKEYANWLF